MQNKTYRVKIGAEYACFSRPDSKVERLSYPVMTPSAARGAIEAIFWKPEIRWRIDRIDVLRPLRETTIMRNEIDTRQSAAQGPILVEQHRQQRVSHVLKDVAYVIHATMTRAAHATEPLAKYMSQFERRVERGQFHHAPYLGLREFAAWFEPATPADEPLSEVNLDVGPMLYDIAFVADGSSKSISFRRHDASGDGIARGFARPIFFDAKVVGGVLDVPASLHEEKQTLEAS